MFYSISTLLIRNLHGVFGENDPARRRAAIAEIFNEECVFYDPKGGVYGNSIRLRSADKLVVYHADNGKVVIIEYEVHGKILRTGATYDNRFVSIITVADRKIVHWRDYMDSLAAWNALNPRSS